MYCNIFSCSCTRRTACRVFFLILFFGWGGWGGAGHIKVSCNLHPISLALSTPFLFLETLAKFYGHHVVFPCFALSCSHVVSGACHLSIQQDPLSSMVFHAQANFCYMSATGRGHPNVVRPLERVGTATIWQLADGVPWQDALPRLTATARCQALPIWMHWGLGITRACLISWCIVRRRCHDRDQVNGWALVF